MSREDYFARSPSFEEPIFEAVADHLAAFSPLHTEFVSVGIFFKRVRTFAELRPKRDRVALSLLLSRRVEHARVVRSLSASALRVACFVDLRDPTDVDLEVREWLTEAYLSSPV
jgi:hypothetical protein